MAPTKQTNSCRKKTECSFCGEVGHNRRGCEIATFAKCFFLDPLDTDQQKKRKCSSCGQEGHYCSTCPLVTIDSAPVEIQCAMAQQAPLATMLPAPTRSKARAPMITKTIHYLHTPVEDIDQTTVFWGDVYVQSCNDNSGTSFTI